MNSPVTLAKTAPEGEQRVATAAADAHEHMPRVRTSATVLAVVLSLLAWYATYMQAQTAERASHVQTWQYLAQEEAEINKIFVEHPEVRPYFFSRKVLLSNDEHYNRVMAVADMQLTFMDAFDDDFVARLPGMEKGGKYQVLWGRYFKQLFSTSPALCLRYDETKDVYSPNVSELGSVGCAHYKQTSNPAVHTDAAR